MKKLFFLFILLPVGAFAQCPQFINQPLRNTEKFMGLMEQRLSFKFSDSSISAARDKMVYNDSTAAYVVKVAAKNNKVHSIYFEAPNADMAVFTKWFSNVFKDCAASTGAETLVFPDCVVMTKPAGTKKKVFYMEAK